MYSICIIQKGISSFDRSLKDFNHLGYDVTWCLSLTLPIIISDMTALFFVQIQQGC